MTVVLKDISMGNSPLLAFLALLMCVVACSPERSALNNGPLLVQEVTLAPTIPAPTRVLSATPSPIVLEISTVDLGTPIITSTIRSNFILVTPTLPPSKTPTHTPTITSTWTPTSTPRPTQTMLSNDVIYITSVPAGVVPVPTALGFVPNAQPCTTPWFFTILQPSSCAMNTPLVSSGSFLQFQNGAMLWIEKQDAIYVLYDSANLPRWQVFNDTFVEGMSDTDPGFNNPPPFTWQPRRGFGLLWRNQPALRDRLGWAVTEAEVPFTPQVQLSSDGMIFISDIRGGVYSLTPDSSDWKRYSG